MKLPLTVIRARLHILPKHQLLEDRRAASHALNADEDVIHTRNLLNHIPISEKIIPLEIGRAHV